MSDYRLDPDQDYAYDVTNQPRGIIPVAFRGSRPMERATFFKHQLETRHEAKDRRKAEKASEQKACYDAVDARDHSVCRVTGVFVVLGHADPHKRKERHHMNPRSLGGEHDTRNVITVSAFLHTQIHAGKRFLSGDADARDPSGLLCGVQYDVLTDAGWKTERMV